MSFPSSRFAFPVLVVLLTVYSFARYLPDLLSFDNNTFADAGWPLAVDSLLEDGLTPTRDFGYFYGLLFLAIDRVWFTVVGRTPMAAVALIGAGCLYLAHGLVRFADAARLGLWPR
ncbi:MAG TPA: hypothetical protein VGL71_02320, partial [Urbifossiella sp.]